MLRRKAATCLALFALVIVATTTPSNAQSWHWNYVTRTPNTPPLAAQSTVTIAGGNLRMTYTVPLGQRQVVIESCHAPMSDVASATMVRTQGRSYFLVQLTPARPAACASGRRPAVALPTDDEHYVSGVVDAINRACCSNVARSAKATPPPQLQAQSPAQPTPTATPKAAPPPSTTDRVDNDGNVSLIRVQNTGVAAVRIRDIAVFGCRDVASGCGVSAREIVLEPRSAMTIATVTPIDGGTTAFHYRYTAARGSDRVSHTGSFGRTAAALHTPALDGADHGTPARLLKRGSSRLAIGETGTALVRMMIAENGTPVEATIVSISNRRLSAAAIETAVSSTYAPATLNGKPIAAKYIATFSFDGDDPALSAIPMWKRSPAPEASVVPTDSAPSEAQPTSTPTPAMPGPPAPALPAPPTPPMPEPTAAPATTEPTATPPQPTPEPAGPVPAPSPSP